MADRESLAAFVDRIVREANITSPRERDALRRELESHFADAASASELSAAIDRFGDPGQVSSELERVHHRKPLVAHALRMLVAVGGSGMVMLLFQAVTNLRFDGRLETLRLSRSFPRSVAFSAVIIVVLVAAWELDVESLCSRLEQRPARLLAVLAALAAVMLLFHAAESMLLSPSVAIAASAVDVAIWTATIAILARTDRVFARVFTTRRQ